MLTRDQVADYGVVGIGIVTVLRIEVYHCACSSRIALRVVDGEVDGLTQEMLILGMGAEADACREVGIVERLHLERQRVLHPGLRQRVLRDILLQHLAVFLQGNSQRSGHRLAVIDRILQHLVLIPVQKLLRLVVHHNHLYRVVVRHGHEVVAHGLRLHCAVLI